MKDYVFADRIANLKPSAIREILKSSTDPAVIPFSAGNPSLETFPIEKMAALAQEVFFEGGGVALQYGITEGYTPLRDTLKKRVKDRFNIGKDFDELVITSGGQQGLDLAVKVLCNEGDIVVVEEPSFIGALNCFRSNNTKLIGVSMENDGVDLEKLENAFSNNPKAKIFYTIPSFQNPLGICTSFEKRKEVYQLCKKYGVVILEDNPYGELRYKGTDIPTYKSMDEEGIVIYAGSLSKIFSPGIRLGFACAKADVISKMVVAKQTIDVHTNLFFQVLIDKFFKRYDINEHVDAINGVYRRKSTRMVESIEQFFPKEVTFTKPEGGLFLWCEMPQKYDAVELAKIGLEKKIAFVPGNAFYTNDKAKSSAFRMNYSTPSDEQITRGVEILGGCIADYFKQK